ncbi:MAG: alpha/beta hydrolase [Methylotenera sp.]|nr:alpha/beta hydrolase [Oligoflexia bacterium]
MKPQKSDERVRHHRFSFLRSCVAISEQSSSDFSRATLIFVHGRFSAASHWLPLVEPLRAHFTSLLVDLPGFGNSFTLDDQGPSLDESAELLAQLISEFSSGPVFLIAHEMGSAIVQLCLLGKSLKEKDRIKGVILLNPLCLSHAIGTLSLNYGAYFLKRRLQKILKGCESLNPDQKQEVIEPWNHRSSRDSILQAFDAYQQSWPDEEARSGWRNSLQDLKQPVLLLQGAQDPINPPEHSFELIRRLPEAYYFQNEKCGHWPSLEQPGWANEKLRDFLWKYSNRSSHIESHLDPLHRKSA